MSPPSNDSRLPYALDKSKVGVPTVYTAMIVQKDLQYLRDKKYIESDDDTISPVMYVKRGGKGILVELFPGAQARFYSKKNTPDPTPTPKPTPFDLNIESPFKFDKVTLTDQAQQEFNKFIELVKSNYSNVTGDVEVTCSASIDGDPEGKVASGQKRKDYDMDLSKKRAQTIVLTLKNSLPGIKLNFIPNGIGETDQFAPGKKFPQSNQNDTAPNRRLIIKLPQIMKKGS